MEVVNLVFLFGLLFVLNTVSAFVATWRLVSSANSVSFYYSSPCAPAALRGKHAALGYSKPAVIRRQGSRRLSVMKFGGGSTDRYSWEETDREVNIKARMPAWAKGKSIVLELNNTHIRLALKEEEDKPIIEGVLRGSIMLDGSYWTMETMEDKGKMLYLTLEKAPHVTGLGPWMGVVVGEKQMDSNYPEEQKAAEVATIMREADMDTSSGDASEPRDGSGVSGPTGEVDEDGFCKDLLTVQGMDVVMVARQVPPDGNALFSAAAMSQSYIETGQHMDVPSQAKELETRAKELRQRTMDFLTEAYEANEPLVLPGKTMPARQFIAAQARANSMEGPDEYLKGMRSDTMWGGGGEVVGLTNVLKRPIHVYELQSTGRRFGLKVLGMFGLPRYSAEKPLHLLSTYAMFPALDPGSQASAGNHYVALFMYDDVPEKNKQQS